LTRTSDAVGDMEDIQLFGGLTLTQIG
jgi:hypothetical protein